MSEFDKQRKAFRQAHGYQPYAEDSHLTNAGLLVLAEGLAEVIELLRPLVETITAKPEPLELRSTGPAMSWCLAGDPTSNGFRRCTEPFGHAGDHVHTDRMTNTVVRWSQREAVQCADYSQVDGDHWCVLPLDHAGVHTDGTEGVTWG